MAKYHVKAIVRGVELYTQADTTKEILGWVSKNALRSDGGNDELVIFDLSKRKIVFHGDPIDWFNRTPPKKNKPNPMERIVELRQGKLIRTFKQARAILEAFPFTTRWTHRTRIGNGYTTRGELVRHKEEFRADGKLVLVINRGTTHCDIWSYVHVPPARLRPVSRKAGGKKMKPEHVPGCPRAVTRVDPDEPSYFGA
jgi:hypothetical protein